MQMTSSRFNSMAIRACLRKPLRSVKSMLLDSSEASQSIVNEVYKRFVASSGPEQSDLTGLLIAASNRNALPPPLIAALLDKAKEAAGRGERLFIDTDYTRILAHAMWQVPAASRIVNAYFKALPILPSQMIHLTVLRLFMGYNRADGDIWRPWNAKRRSGK
jgi:hypothetical protein